MNETQRGAPLCPCAARTRMPVTALVRVVCARSPHRVACRVEISTRERARLILRDQVYETEIRKNQAWIPNPKSRYVRRNDDGEGADILAAGDLLEDVAQKPDGYHVTQPWELRGPMSAGDGGWTYASSHTSATWSVKGSRASKVRRRLWARQCEASNDEIADETYQKHAQAARRRTIGAMPAPRRLSRGNSTAAIPRSLNCMLGRIGIHSREKSVKTWAIRIYFVMVSFGQIVINPLFYSFTESADSLHVQNGGVRTDMQECHGAVYDRHSCWAFGSRVMVAPIAYGAVISCYLWLLKHCENPEQYLLQSHRKELVSVMNRLHVLSSRIWLFSLGWSIVSNFIAHLIVECKHLDDSGSCGTGGLIIQLLVYVAESLYWMVSADPPILCA